jgi:hypothetical protein
LASTGCSSSERGEYAVQILRWRCVNGKEYVLCDLSMRSDVQAEGEVVLNAEYFDESGNKINLCDQCQTPQRRDGQKDVDPEKPWYVLMGFKGDEEFWVIMAGAPASRGIKRYRFYIQDLNSGKTVSNIIEGKVAEPQ